MTVAAAASYSALTRCTLRLSAPHAGCALRGRHQPIIRGQRG
eukprot:COSAG01_NODE_48224_length_383_cov_0.721831_1_plen_41_part_10